MKKLFAALFCIRMVTGCTNQTQTPNVNPLTHQWTLEGFIKADSINPILAPSPEQVFYCPIIRQDVHWEARNVLNPTAIVKDGKIFLLYRAQDPSGTSRIGLATSIDGLHFVKEQSPVFFPERDTMFVFEWNKNKDAKFTYLKDPKATFFDGVEDPRIIETEEGNYLMTYTAYDGQTARLCLAISRDLKSWRKYGPVLTSPKFQNFWSKSGAIVVKQMQDKVVATKIDGKYWMYFGDTNLFMATSKDLIHWDVVENSENGKLIGVLHPRSGYFDSRLVEPGPFALLRNTGILLIYNASNAANYNEPGLPKFTYAAGQALFDKERPYKLLARTDNFFIHPEKDYERIGEVNEVCFVEGLAHFQDKWFLYYGTADSKIAVAVAND